MVKVEDSILEHYKSKTDLNGHPKSKNTTNPTFHICLRFHFRPVLQTPHPIPDIHFFDQNPASKASTKVYGRGSGRTRRGSENDFFQKCLESLPRASLGYPRPSTT